MWSKKVGFGFGFEFREILKLAGGGGGMEGFFTEGGGWGARKKCE